MEILSVGKEFNGAVPSGEGSVLEIDPMGAFRLYIQLPDISQGEMAALKEGFSAYSLFVSNEHPHLITVIFKYPAPLGYMETYFHAGLYDDSRISEMLLRAPHENNMLITTAFDKRLLLQTRISGLAHDFVAIFQKEVSKHKKISSTLYDLAIERNGRFSLKELFGMGKQFKHYGNLKH